MKTLPLTQIQPTVTEAKLPSGKGPVADTGFGHVLKSSLQDVNATMQHASQMSEGLVTGQHSNIHETMIAMEKSKVSFRLLTKVQQKAISAYQTIMRMQV